MNKISLLAMGSLLVSLNATQAACPIFTNYDDVKMMLGNAGIQEKKGSSNWSLKIIKFEDSFNFKDPKNIAIFGKEEDEDGSCYYKIAIKTDESNTGKRQSPEKLGFFVLKKTETTQN